MAIGLRGRPVEGTSLDEVGAVYTVAQARDRVVDFVDESSRKCLQIKVFCEGRPFAGRRAGDGGERHCGYVGNGEKFAKKVPLYVDGEVLRARKDLRERR